MAKATAWWPNDPYRFAWRKAAFKGMPRQPMSTWDRFNSKLTPGPGDCGGWTGAHFTQTGYALFVIRGADGKWRPTVGHRIAYELYIAEIPPGLVIDHLCRNRGCVNPWHMEPVTRGENVRRGWLALGHVPSEAKERHLGSHPNWALTPGWDGRCQRGHLITPETLIVRKNGKHECRTCARARDRARNANGGRREHYAAMYRKRKAVASR